MQRARIHLLSSCQQCIRHQQWRTLASSSASQPKPKIEATGPLKGIKILDLGRVLAAPYASMILGDLGADVIKIEQPGSGDDTRHWGPPFAKNIDPNDTGKPESAYFLGINRNKKSMTVNLKHPDGVAIIKKLAAKCDILIENYLPGKLDEMGLGYEVMKQINPRLIYASVTGYGPTGPDSQKPGYDLMIEAEAGLMYITGERDGPPVKVGVAITDMVTGLYAHGGILAALIARQKTNRGQKVDVSLIESQAAALANIAHNWLIGGVEASRWGTSHPSIVPYQRFPTKDSFVVVGAGNDRQFGKLVDVMGMGEFKSDERFRTNDGRVKNRVVLIETMSNIFKTQTTEYWLKALEPINIPFAPVNNIAQTFAHPQVIHRKMIEEVDHPRAGKIKIAGIPVKYSGTPPNVRLPPPVLGQHTREVLSTFLDYSDNEIDAFIAEKVV
ncbi:hypothetical protein SmJEL517_g01406 [Synchytrium microbalum]|uniref:Formyl-CoA transferase n=1 Tax=Synchytrium microbalum TaxID=1806994 RepID=A0A507CFB1_9FUNG|nr:uncharacterized protein SmJEL517_g01406 [Synchytrium microbalum]TPX36275.1 hypothetical protein SmJEL517_g01406 [Synchytrium microbalum]